MTQFDKMIEFLDQSWKLRDQIVPCLVGPVGIGKTAAVEQHAKNVGANNVVKIVASQILPNEVSGITMPNDADQSMDIYDHYRLSHMQDGDILFFDELLEADQSVLKACLTLIESREMMSGKKLPDVQIVAATNPTIMASTLAENIRQRFMFMRFDLDRTQAIDYIEQTTGLNLRDLFTSITCEGGDYNILTPRSLTKLARWCLSIEPEKLDDWARMVNDMWNPIQVGSIIVQARRQRDLAPEFQVRDQIKEEFFKIHASADPHLDFYNDSFADIVDTLEGLDVWNMIKDSLANKMIREAEIVL